MVETTVTVAAADKADGTHIAKAAPPTPDHDIGSNGPSGGDTDAAQGTSTTELTSADAMATSGGGEGDQRVIELKVQLPGKATEPIMLPLLSTDCIQDLRQYISDQAAVYANTCYYFEAAGQRLNDMAEIGSIEGLHSGDTIYVRNDRYNDRAVAIHLRRLREILRAMSGRVELDAGHPAANGEQYTPVYLPHVLNGVFGEPGAINVSLEDVYASPTSKAAASKGGAASENGTSASAIVDVTMSRWNPPPGPRGLKGDLAYVRVELSTGSVLHFVANTHGFYLSKTTDDRFDPSESSTGRGCRAHTLAESLAAVCPEWKTQLAAHLKAMAERSALETLPAPYAVAPWMRPDEPHVPDSIRAEDATSRWSEADPINPGMIRDWDDELQTLSHLECGGDSPTDPLLRDRALYKFHTDYVAAASRGAQAAVLGNIPPMNPADPPESQMFVWNQMFLSFATNARGIFSEHGGEEAAHAAAGNDLRGVRAMSAVGSATSGLCVLATVIVDYLGRRVVAQSIVPGILRRTHTNAIVYGANDAEGTMVVDPTFAAGLERCSAQLFSDTHKVRHTNGDVVTLHSSAECKGIIGTDGRHYVLDLIRTTPTDINFAMPERLDAADVECRGQPVRLMGASADTVKHMAPSGSDATTASDGTPALWRPRHGLCVLRRELLLCFREALAVKRAQAAVRKADGERAPHASGVANGSDGGDSHHHGKEAEPNGVAANGHSHSHDGVACNHDHSHDDAHIEADGEDQDGLSGKLEIPDDDFKFNLDAYTNVELADSPEKIESDKKIVKSAGEFLRFQVVPSFVAELKGQQVWLLDGEALTVLMHERGINMRYLGIIAASLEPHDSSRPIVLLEMLSRAAKVHLRKCLQAADVAQLSEEVSHFLSCLVGGCVASTAAPTSARKKGKAKDRSGAKSFSSTLTSEALWSGIVATCRTNFFCEVPHDIVDVGRVDRGALVRAVCKKTGVQLLARTYAWDVSPAVRPGDILNIFPTIKHAAPKCTPGALLFAEGRRKLQQGQVRQSLAMLEAAAQEMQQVYGLLHSAVADVNRVQAYILSHATESPDIPIAYQEKTVLILERVHGRDHPDVIRGYIALGQYLHTAQRLERALAALSYARQLCIAAAGTSCPELPSVETRIAMCLVGLQKPERALEFLDIVQKRLREEHAATKEGDDSASGVSLAQTSLLRARALQQMGDLRAALMAAREAHGLFAQKFGDTDVRTRECFGQVNRLAAEAVQKEREKKESMRILRVDVPAVFPTKRGGGTLSTK